MMDDRIELIQGDITVLAVDGVVNAANNSLLGGGGVDGAIHRAAGPELRRFCRGLGGCDTGDVKITPGFNLKAAVILHTVGPVWQGGAHREAELLASCYRRCFALARQHGLTSLAFPAISTGAYGFPEAAAARIAVRQTRVALGVNPAIRKVMFVCFAPSTRLVYQEALAEP